VRGFCDAQFSRDHTTRGEDVSDVFLKSSKHIRDSEEVSQVTRNLAKIFASTMRPFIKRAWQQCYDDNMAHLSLARLQKRQGAQHNFGETAALPPTLNWQLEGG